MLHGKTVGKKENPGINRLITDGKCGDGICRSVPHSRHELTASSEEDDRTQQNVEQIEGEPSGGVLRLDSFRYGTRIDKRLQSLSIYAKLK